MASQYLGHLSARARGHGGPGAARQRLRGAPVPDRELRAGARAGVEREPEVCGPPLPARLCAGRLRDCGAGRGRRGRCAFRPPRAALRTPRGRAVGVAPGAGGGSRKGLWTAFKYRFRGWNGDRPCVADLNAILRRTRCADGRNSNRKWGERGRRWGSGLGDQPGHRSDGLAGGSRVFTRQPPCQGADAELRGRCRYRFRARRARARRAIDGLLPPRYSRRASRPLVRPSSGQREEMSQWTSGNSCEAPFCRMSRRLLCPLPIQER